MNKKNKLLSLVLILISLSALQAQVGIGTITPDASAALELQSTDKGFLPPRMDTEARNNINSPAEGLVIYNTDENCVQFFQGSLWFDLCEGGLLLGGPSDCDNVPFLSAEDTEIVEVTNSVTGVTWMDRNLGAFAADRTPPSAASGTDCWAYGNLYQWGRNSDGHEDRTSNETAGAVAAGSEGSDFIKVDIHPYDWLRSPDNDRWNANETAGGSVVKTANDPCPAGYRVPTEAELNAERNSWTQTPINSTNNREGAINSPLKLPVAGYRRRINGALSGVGSYGYYWSSTVSGSSARRLDFSFSNAEMIANDRARGLSVRCIKD